MSTKSHKFQYVITVAVMLSMVLAACASSPTVTVQATQASQSSGSGSSANPTTAPTQASTSSSTGSTQVKNPDTLVWGTIGDPESLDPAWAYDTASGSVIFNVYETLLFPKKDSYSDFVPMLATNWTISSDGMTYTFDIRKGVTFDQGETLTPGDVAYSFWRGLIQDRAGGPQWIMLQPFFGLNVQSFQNDVVKAQFNGDFQKACEAVQSAITFDNNAGTVTMHLKQPYGPMLQILTGTWASIVNQSWVVQQGGWDGNCSDAEKYHDPSAENSALFKTMNGTGPYQFVSWQPNAEIDLVRNDNYWLKTPLWDGGPSGPAAVKNVIIKDIPEFGTRFASFQTGDLDIAYIDTQYISQADPLVAQTCTPDGTCTNTANANAPFRLWKDLPTVSQSSIYLTQAVNTTGGNNYIGSGKLDGNGVPANFFSDINIRQAFNYCFDWTTYIKQVWNGEAQQVYGPIIQGELGYDPNQAHYTFDLTKCADAFKASTLKNDKGQTVWDTGFYLQYIYNTGNDQRKVAGEILQQDLQKVNPKFHLEVVGEPFALELKDSVAGRLPIYMLGWLEDYHDPNDWVQPYLASNGTYSGSQGFSADLSKQMDQLIQQGVQESDPTARAKIYGQLQNLAYQNALDIFVVQPFARHYEQMWVKGYYYNPIYPGIYFYVLSK